VLITPRAAESPGSGHIGVIGAINYFLPSETVRARDDGALQRAIAAHPLDQTRGMRTDRGVYCPNRGVYGLGRGAALYIDFAEYTPLFAPFL